MKYRWVDTEGLVVSVARQGSSYGWLRGRVGQIVVVPTASRKSVGNVLVDFDGLLVVVPVGTLRRKGWVPTRQTSWTVEEDQILRDNYPI